MRRRTTGWGLAALLLALLITADVAPAQPGVPPGPKLGDPLPGLTSDQLAAFERGKLVFSRRFRPSEGLGPFYNATSCASCHSTPVPGGASDLYRNFYLAVYQFGATTVQQSSSIPPFLSQVVPAFGSGDTHSTADFTLEGGRPLLPDTFSGFPVLSTQRNAIPVFGVGLFELISDATILSNADPADLNGDGISGQVNTQFLGVAIGRMGMKSQVNNIELFTRGPLQNQMGITSDPVLGSAGLVSFAHAPFQVGSSPDDPETDADSVPDPEISEEDLSDLIAFGKFIAPPTPKPFNRAARNGQALFSQLNCTGCHIPSLPSSRGPVNAYTDLLLHNVGVALRDNIMLGENIATVNEFRTQPLWGISKFAPYLHDGRAPTLIEAILAHAGEALDSRDDFVALTPAQQQDLITFLEHL